MSVTVVDHPVIRHKLTRMRDRHTETAEFRRLLKEIGMIFCYEVTRDLKTRSIEVETPIGPYEGAKLGNIALVAILRAGVGMVDGMLACLSSARVGHVGLYRDPETLEAVKYYFKLPPNLDETDVIVVDPMLATGNTAVLALEMIKAEGPRSLRFASLLSAPEGIAALQAAHPDVPIYTCAVDDGLNDHAYIVPGLGDAGDRIFGTR